MKLQNATIDRPQIAWLKGDLTNHNDKSAILPDKQIRQDSRLTSVDLNLKMFVYWCLSMVKIKYISDVHPCLFHVLNKYEKTNGSFRLRWGNTVIFYDTLKSHNMYLLFEFLKNDQIWKLTPCFIPQVTFSLLSVRVLSVFSFTSWCIFHCVRTWCVVWEGHCLSNIATVTKEGKFLRRVNSPLSLQHNVLPF